MTGTRKGDVWLLAKYTVTQRYSGIIRISSYVAGVKDPNRQGTRRGRVSLLNEVPIQLSVWQ